MGLGYTKCVKTNFWLDISLIHFLGGEYDIYSPRIEQFDWTVWSYHDTIYFSCNHSENTYISVVLDTSYEA